MVQHSLKSFQQSFNNRSTIV